MVQIMLVMEVKQESADTRYRTVLEKFSKIIMVMSNNDILIVIVNKTSSKEIKLLHCSSNDFQ